MAKKRHIRRFGITKQQQNEGRTKTTERDIEKFCHGFGNITDVILKKGFCFVDFEDQRDAEDAIYELNNRELLGARVVVETVKEDGGGRGDRGERSHGRPYRGREEMDRRPKWLNKYGAPEQTNYKLSVENLSTRCSWQDLKDLMRGAGEVTYADAHKQERNKAVVCFARHSDLKRAIEKFQGKDINGRKIKLIDESRARESRSRSRVTRSRSRTPRSRSPRSPAARRSRSPLSRSRSRSRS